MEKQKVKELLKELEEIAGIKNVKLEFRKMKRKLASTSLNKGIIRLNKVVLTFPEHMIKFILAHEIAHIKLKTKYHDVEFRKILAQLLEDDVEKLEKELIELIL